MHDLCHQTFTSVYAIEDIYDVKHTALTRETSARRSDHRYCN